MNALVSHLLAGAVGLITGVMATLVFLVGTTPGEDELNPLNDGLNFPKCEETEIERQVKKNMKAIENLQQNIAALDAEVATVKTGVASLNAKIADLVAQLAAATNTDPAIQAAADSIALDVAALDATINPPAAPTA